LLRNRIYVGEITHRKQSYPGHHTPIVPQPLWNTVAKRLSTNNRGQRAEGPASSASMLCGILFDSSGVRFTPTHAVKKGKRYRYYTSQSVIQGLKERPQITRFPAPPLEEFVSRQVGHYLQNFSAPAAGIEHGPESELIQTRAHSLGERWKEIPTERYHQLLHQLLTKVVVGPTSVELLLDAKKLSTELLGRSPEHSLSVSQLRCTA
jgi:site-specific DNA recombinase